MQTIKQCFLDSNGNEARLTMSQYLTNCLKASECLTKNAFELDFLLYVADIMDPAVKSHMEADNYKNHYKPRAHDWKIQMKSLREIVKHAAAAEEKVQSLRKEVRRNTTAALVSIPGFNASALTPSPALKSVAEETNQSP